MNGLSGPTDFSGSGEFAPRRGGNSAQQPSKADLLVKMVNLQLGLGSLLMQAEFAKNAGDLDGAIAAYEPFIDRSREYLDLALLHNRLHPYPVEIEPIVQPLLNALHTQADLLQARGRPEVAAAARDEALTLARAHLGEVGEAAARRAVALSLMGQARFNEALVQLEEARGTFRRAGRVVELAKTTLDSVDLLHWLGDHSRALAELDEVMRVMTALMPSADASLGTTRAAVEDALGTLARDAAAPGVDAFPLDGLKSMERAFELYQFAIRMEFYRGLIQKDLGDLDAAQRSFANVLPHQQGQVAVPALEVQLASLQLARGKYREALEHLARLEPHFRQHQLLRPKLAVLLRDQAKGLLALGDTAGAIRKLDEGIADLAAHYDPDALWTLESLRGRAARVAGDTDGASSAYRRAAATVNGLRKTPLGHRLDSTYLKDKLPLFAEAIALAAEADRARESCELIEMIKSRLLTSTLSIDAVRGRAEAAHVEGREQRLDLITRKLDALEYAAYRDGWTPETRSRRQALLAERAALLEQIRFSDPRWRTVTEPVPFDLGEVERRLLGRRHAALSLYYAPGRVVAVLVKDGSSTVATREIAPVTASRLGVYVRNLQERNPSPQWFDLSGGLSVTAEDLLPPELLERALGAKRLVLSPYGPLHLVPWAGLTFRGKRLFEYCPVGIVPNLSCVVMLDGPLAERPKAALIGAPDYSGLRRLHALPSAAREMEEIGELYAETGRLLAPPIAHEHATEAAFLELARRPDTAGTILHVVCHGDFVADEPMSSGLLLTNSKVDAAEIARSSLLFDEVVLSACSTGYRPLEVGDVELSGDDILGLPGALLEAGVRSVLVSIPPAEDSATGAFMRSYHTHRRDGKTPLEAVQQTQRIMLDTPEFPPYYWIGLTVYGCR